MKLPDCAALDEPLALLTAQEKRDLMLRMADGEEALRAWVEERARHDPKWNRILQRLQGRVEEEVEAYRDRVQEELEADEERIERTRRRREEEVTSGIERVQRRLADKRAERAEVLDRALSKAELARMAKEADEARSAWQRFVAWLRRTWSRIVRWFRRRLGRGGDDATRIRLAGPGGAATELDVGFALAQSPDFRKAIKDRLRSRPFKERLRDLRDRLLARRDYDEIVADMVKEEVEQAREEEERRLEQEEETVEEELETLEGDLEQTRERAREALAEVERRRREAEEELRRRMEEEPYEELAGRVRAELERTGLVDEKGPTLRLLRRLGDLLFEAEVRGLEGRIPKALARAQGAESALEKHPLVTLAERSRVALVDSLVHARTHHPRVRHITDQDLVVYRNTEQPRAHVVLICDTSASMEEHERMDAAKRATLALHGAVANHSPDHRIDVVLMGTEVRRAGLQDVWTTEPAGFTNTGGALALARRLLASDPADLHLVILVTDGLPEAVMEGGEAVAAHPGEATAYAIKQAERLAGLADLQFVCLLLEPDDPLFVEAGEEIAEVLDGHVAAVRPEELAGHLLLEFAEGVVAKGKPVPA